MLKPILYLSFFCYAASLFGQAGALDFSFSPGLGTNGNLMSIAIQPDAKILIGGDFTAYDGTTTNRLARLLPDGALDTAFSTPSGANGPVHAIAVQADGKILIGGEFVNYDGSPRFYLERLLPDGSRDTAFYANFIINNYVHDIKIQPDDKILVAGKFTTRNGAPTSCVIRLQPNGNYDTSFVAPAYAFASQGVQALAIQPDGKVVIGGNFLIDSTANFILARLLPNGRLDTNFATASAPAEAVQALALTADGRILVGGDFTQFSGSPNAYLLRVDTVGQIDPTFAPPALLQSPVYDIALQPNQNIIIAGAFANYNFCARLLPDGSIDNNYSWQRGPDADVYCLALQNDGKLLIGGAFSQSDATSRPHVARLHLDSLGLTLGRVFLDPAQTCTNNQLGLANRLITILPPNILAQTNSMGYWQVPALPAGTYTAVVDTSAAGWSPTCPISQTFTVAHIDSFTQGPNFGFAALNACAAPYTSIITNNMRVGAVNQVIRAQACNLYTASAPLDSAYLIIALDTPIYFQSASHAYTALANNQYRFNLGTLPIGHCEQIEIYADISTTTPPAQTLFMSANLYPRPYCALDTRPQPFPIGQVAPCLGAWDGSDISISATCAGDSLYFEILNAGQDMACFHPLRTYRDNNWVATDSVQLNSGATYTLVLAGNAQTVRVEVPQHPLHPGLSSPSATIENCGQGTWTPNLINAMPQDDADPFIDIFGLPLNAPFDPNDKTGFPLGVGPQHHIQPLQPIQYLIRFQNVGTDTAFNVVVRDTLAAELDINTVISGASSAAYSFRIYGPRVLEWTFADIRLVDSATNAPQSQGFIAFSVQQIPNLPLGTALRNSAAIYFDYQPAVITNTYLHTLADFLFMPTPVERPNPVIPFAVSVSPMPFNATALLEIKGLANTEKLTLQLYNAQGQAFALDAQQYQNQFIIQRGGLAAGVYFVRVSQDGLPIAQAKIMID